MQNNNSLLSYCQEHGVQRGPAWSAVAIGILCSSKNLSNFTSGASGKRWSAETEVRKRKYGSEKKSHLSVFSALLTQECVCWGLVDKRGLNFCNVKARYSALGHCGEHRYHNVHVTARLKSKQTLSTWANHVGSMLLECLDSDAVASVVVVLLQ